MMSSAQASEPRVLAAGSLRLAVTELLETYESERGVAFGSLFGPSGKLRELIENGEPFTMFLSASKKHTDALLDQGLVRGSEPFTRNALCLMVAPGMMVEPDDVVDVMLDPAVRLGTSTPKADPSGDYTWEMFRRIDEQRPGAFDKLDAKALKLTGGQVDRARKGLPYPDVFKENEADVFVSYCTNAVATAGEVDGLTYVRIPERINVAAQYGMALAPGAGVESQGLAAFIRGQRGREILARYGFQ
ncbi:MAG: molybdate ABC transporter substrate-binding protein [Gammaproteobacteria bacterium]|nr:molybdate ABC transporter substrate-binding protein [Gammaproteobacteria bacterium]